MGSMHTTTVGQKGVIMAKDLSKQALLGIIYSWYTCLQTIGMSEEDAIIAMTKAWRMVASIYNTDSANANKVAKDLVIKLNQSISDKKPNSINSYTGPISLNRLFNDNYETEWLKGNWKWE